MGRRVFLDGFVVHTRFLDSGFSLFSIVLVCCYSMHGLGCSDVAEFVLPHRDGGRVSTALPSVTRYR